MSPGRKRILSNFTGCKKQKAWNNTGKKYMREERRQNLAETDRRSFYNQEEWEEEFLNDKDAFSMVVKVMMVIMMMRLIMKI